MSENWKYNQTWQDKIHPHCTNFPLNLWELIEQEKRRTHTNAGDIIRTRLWASYCKDRPATKQDFKESKVEWQDDRPKRYQGVLGIWRRNLGAFLRYRRLQERERTKEAMKEIFSQKDLS